MNAEIIRKKQNKKMKKTSWGSWSFFGEGISFLMGCSKNYIMYWGGVTCNNIPHISLKVLTNINKIKK
ncbi:hypothetical protein DS742_03295 [Lacrimispora amygdalina]|uniref:Uncharacterized protein n=1 Tax=Lacrimispora amygdalina TaxID=253257 RepID=A0A3E2NHA2_9FIRM|nr:hypothetical protein DS742_03295 [Clostridium indicum]